MRTIFLFIFCLLQFSLAYGISVDSGNNAVTNRVVLTKVNDTSEYSILLNELKTNPERFEQGKTYFFVKNNDLSIAIKSFSGSFEKNQDLLTEYLKAYSTNKIFIRSDFESFAKTGQLLFLNSGKSIQVIKEADVLMFTDKKTFESVSIGNFIRNNISVFFIEMPFN